MPDIKPLKGIRYNPEMIDNFAAVICQPYDQITDTLEKQYKNRSPYNFVRLVLTKYAEGHDRQKEYADAKRYATQWLKEGIFVQDKIETIYSYRQEFAVGEKKYLRKGFMCLVRLEELGKGNILPHEKTLSKPKEDRLNLLRVTQYDFEPVFLLYTDPDNTINKLIQKECKKAPLIDVTDDKDVTHKLWRIQKPKIINEIKSTLKDSIFVIADGHHRYETALNYRSELKNINANNPVHFKLITLVNIEDPGLVVLPTHRLIKNVSDFNLATFLEKTDHYFEIKKTDRNSIAQELAEQKSEAFGFYSPQTAYILKLKSKDVMKKFLSERSDDYQGLDVTILHTLLIENVLGITPEKIEDHVRYERGADATMKRVDSGEFQFCFLMNPTRPEQVKNVAQNRERMPQKSTDFYPKVISGLVFYSLA